MATKSQETDVWWGSYSGWTMMPSMVVCVVLTAVIAWCSWRVVPRGWVQLSVLGFAGAVWLVELARFAHRVFGYNYRLTTQRIYCQKGLAYWTNCNVELADIVSVENKRLGFANIFGLGQIVLTTVKGNSLNLYGVRNSQQVADLIERAAACARECATGQKTAAAP